LLNEKREAGVLATGPNIIGNVFIHENAKVHESAVIGPNVTIAADVRVKAGVRIRNSIILESVTLHAHSCIIDSIIGWNSIIGPWARVEGDSQSNDENPISILGLTVKVAAEVYLRKVIVISYKEIGESQKNAIIL
jgi:mannose-1-phosphate guanylyltransferase